MSKQLKDLVLELFTENDLEQYGLAVSEADGLLRLAGTVPTWELVVRAGQLAGSLPGVRSVVNEIGATSVEPAPYKAPPGDPSVIGTADIVIIGAGVVGTAIARELARYKLDIVLVEKDSDVGCGASRANNGMVHSGIVQEPNSLRSKLNVRGNAMFEELCRELDVPFKRCGLIGLVFKEEELILLDLVKARAEADGIPVEVISRERALAMEPALSPETKGAFLAPSTAMTSPYKLTIAYAENAVTNGVRLFLNTEVTAMEEKDGRVCKVITSRGSFNTRFLINAAGIYADRIAAMTGEPEFTLHPRKGELLIFDREKTNDHAAMATGLLAIGLDPHTKGGGTMFTMDGNPEWGPTAQETADREDTAVTAAGINRIIEKFNPLLPGYDPNQSLINFFAGIRAATYTEDFHIAPSSRLKGLINVAGIQSPGLVAAPAIAAMVLDLLRQEGLNMDEKEQYEPRRFAPARFKELPVDEQNSLIRSNPAYGHIICRCEQVTEAEITAALHRPVPALTLDAVKRRTRAGMGRCQGSFCLPRVLLIMSRELGIPLAQLTKSGLGSPLFSRQTKEAPPYAKEDWFHAR
ncbi:MAG: FAD-dependent oxidoreductase [Bacillota bacterium]